MVLESRSLDRLFFLLSWREDVRLGGAAAETGGFAAENGTGAAYARMVLTRSHAVAYIDRSRRCLHEDGATVDEEGLAAAIGLFHHIDVGLGDLFRLSYPFDEELVANAGVEAFAVGL